MTEDLEGVCGPLMYGFDPISLVNTQITYFSAEQKESECIYYWLGIETLSVRPTDELEGAKR